MEDINSDILTSITHEDYHQIRTLGFWFNVETGTFTHPQLGEVWQGRSGQFYIDGAAFASFEDVVSSLRGTANGH